MNYHRVLQTVMHMVTKEIVFKKTIQCIGEYIQNRICEKQIIIIAVRIKYSQRFKR